MTGGVASAGPQRVCGFIPPYLLEQLRACDDADKSRSASRTLVIDATLRASREADAEARSADPVAKAWEIHTAGNTTTLPGTLVRSAGDPDAGDAAVDEAATGITATLSLYREVFGRDSYDGQGAGVLATVHYGQDYDNAFWNGTQLVFGDGDRTIFDRFTKPIDVIGHELSHALTEKTAGLTYQGQSGTLNESISDVFGSCMKQRVLGQSAADADWLVGQGIFLPGVQGMALRSMEAPGTAYDDPDLGKDPQVGSMDDYVETTEDNGGVHLNSGIPNRAFYLAATAIGGSSGEGAGRIWYAALTSGIGRRHRLRGLRRATVEAAGEHANAVTTAWTTVGVTPGASSAGGTPPPGPTTPQVQVVRSGGFAGRRVSGAVDLTAADLRASDVRDLVDRIDFSRLPAGTPQPDRYVYEFRTPAGGRVVVQEQDLTADLRRLAALVLDD